MTNTHRQRLHGLTQLASSILGPNSVPQDLVAYINARLQDVIHVPTNIWGPLQGDMRALCRFAKWHIPASFEVYPMINSPAALLYWRILVFLLGQLTDVERTEFYLTYDTGHSPGEAPRRSSTSGSLQATSSTRQRSGETFPLTERPQATCLVGSPHHASTAPPRIVEKLVPSDRRGVTTVHPPSPIRVTIGTEQDGGPLRSATYTTEVYPPAFDSHFHIDRTARKLGVEDVAAVAVEEILGCSLPHAPSNPVKLVGGVMVFCDPETKLTLPLMDGRWKVAVGLHPKKVSQCTPGYLSNLKTLLDSNPLVTALGEIGLDRSEPDYLWAEQDRVFRKLLTICHPGRVLVLHLRESSNRHCSDVLMAALQYVRKACPVNQKIHLHCFTGLQSDVENWLEDFPNCYFGFTARVAAFTDAQLDALKYVPSDRILLETDSPYMPVDRNNEVNTPAYLGDVAKTVARCRGVSMRELLAVTVTNGQRLYQ